VVEVNGGSKERQGFDLNLMGWDGRPHGPSVPQEGGPYKESKRWAIGYVPSAHGARVTVTFRSSTLAVAVVLVEGARRPRRGEGVEARQPSPFPSSTCGPRGGAHFQDGRRGRAGQTEGCLQGEWTGVLPAIRRKEKATRGGPWVWGGQWGGALSAISEAAWLGTAGRLAR
jgi:hypothetical protein